MTEQTPVAGIDLSSFDTSSKANEGEWMHVLNPGSLQPLYDAAKRPARIKLAGIDSERYQRATRAVTDRRLAMRGRTKIKAEELEAENIELLAQCTIAVENIALGGKAVDNNVHAYRQLYETLPWLREQANDFIGERSNFLSNSKSG